MSGLRSSVPNNNPGAEMGCTTPGAVGAGAMGHSAVAAAGRRPGRRIGACPSRFGRRINGCLGLMSMALHPIFPSAEEAEYRPQQLGQVESVPERGHSFPDSSAAAET